MAYKVIQWYTGAIARQQIRMVQAHPNLELAGAVVHHEEKEGKDVGEILGEAPIGVSTVRGIEAALKLDADVVLYNAPFERYDEIVQMLARGLNVITPAGAVYPKAGTEYAKLVEACEAGQSTLLGTGVNPGFAGDVLPLVASSLCGEVRSVRVRELGDIGDWDPFMLTEVMKFGSEVKDLEASSEYFALMTTAFQQSCLLVAEGLGFPVERVGATSEFAVAKTDLLGGKVKAGTVGGIHLQVNVVSDGRAVVTEDLYWRVAEDLEPAWPLSPGDGEWLVEIEGEPNVKLSASLSPGEWRGSTGQIATAARIVNSIPDVCDAAPGILTGATIPMPRCHRHLGREKSG